MEKQTFKASYKDLIEAVINDIELVPIDELLKIYNDQISSEVTGVIFKDKLKNSEIDYNDNDAIITISWEVEEGEEGEVEQINDPIFKKVKENEKNQFNKLNKR